MRNLSGPHASVILNLSLGSWSLLRTGTDLCGSYWRRKSRLGQGAGQCRKWKRFSLLLLGKNLTWTRLLSKCEGFAASFLSVAGDLVSPSFGLFFCPFSALPRQRPLHSLMSARPGVRALEWPAAPQRTS